MKLLIPAILLLLAPVVAGAQQNPPAADDAGLPHVQLPPELDRVLRDYEQAWHASDAAALAALFTEDGFVLGSGRPPVRGRAAVVESYTSAGGPLSLRAYAWAAGDSVGYIIGAYAGSPDRPDEGKFILALRRRPGGPWQIAADMDNLNRRRSGGPPAPAAAPPAGMQPR